MREEFDQLTHTFIQMRMTYDHEQIRKTKGNLVKKLNVT